MSERQSRRDFLKTAGIAGAAAAVVPGPTALAQMPGDMPMPEVGSAADRAGVAAAAPKVEVLFFLNDEEARFIAAAVGRLIPADEEWGGANEAGVLYYIDRQLASAYGAGARMYLDGPWDPSAPPEQGYQLRYAPADLIRVGIRETRAWLDDKYARELWDLSPDQIDEVLSMLESGAIELPSLPAPAFFETLLAKTIEGFFSDPIYGGNRDMIGWRMVGFPGAYGQYVGLVDQWGYDFDRPPVGISNADEVLGHRHDD